MKKVIIGILMVMFSLPAFAVDRHIDLDGLSDTQKAELALKVEKLKAKKDELPKVTPNEVKEYAEVIKLISGGVGAAAKELGIAANEFVKTPVGVLTAAVLVWRYMGDDLMGLIVGVPWFIFFNIFWIYMYRRTVLLDTVSTYVKGKREDGKTKVVKYKEKCDISGELAAWLWLLFLIIQGAGLVIIF